MLTLALMATICAQAADISGIVVDKANQEPLIGATVMAGDKGTTTDIDGKFAIKGITTRNIRNVQKITSAIFLLQFMFRSIAKNLTKEPCKDVVFILMCSMYFIT